MSTAHNGKEYLEDRAAIHRLDQLGDTAILLHIAVIKGNEFSSNQLALQLRRSPRLKCSTSTPDLQTAIFWAGMPNFAVISSRKVL
jgi:hypothetical protein